MTASTDYVARIVDELGAAPTPQALATALVPEMADSSIVFQRQDDRYRIVALAHIDPAKYQLLEELRRIHAPAIDDSRDPVAIVGRARQGVLVPWVTRQNVERATDDARVHAIFDAFGPRDIVLVPIRDGDYVLVAVVSDTPRSFYEGDLEFFSHLATRVAPLLP